VDTKESSFGGMEAAVSRLEEGESWEGRYIVYCLLFIEHLPITAQ